MASSYAENNDLASPPSLMSLMMGYTPPPRAAVLSPPPPVTENRTASSSITLEPPPPPTVTSESRNSITSTKTSTARQEEATQVRILKRESIQIEIQQPPTAHFDKHTSDEPGLRGKKAVTIFSPARSHQDVGGEKESLALEEKVGAVKKGRGRKRGCGGCWGFW
ncbi:hypothetical protein QC764_0076770 [Podospora pseudoanserina]|uniref:Uncharacterized protein n=1 Tax=Podospora pseudoanserina TaxID=2609844 RepID=A0ABR0I4L9_9PEZI|nr:hypothetical protein QC764_0076770 [Podospora pseudoanserina]